MTLQYELIVFICSIVQATGHYECNIAITVCATRNQETLIDFDLRTQLEISCATFAPRS
jgi:hypothetical protein